MSIINAKDIDLKNLGSFAGTESFHKLILGLVGTDGIEYLMSNGYAWAVTDACIILKKKLMVSREDFVVVSVEPMENNRAKISYEDRSGNLLFGQEYAWSDAIVRFKMIYSNGIIMLSGEY